MTVWKLGLWGACGRNISVGSTGRQHGARLAGNRSPAANAPGPRRLARLRMLPLVFGAHIRRHFLSWCDSQLRLRGEHLLASASSPRAWDAVIVGAGIHGASFACQLKASSPSARVLLIDKAARGAAHFYEGGRFFGINSTLNIQESTSHRAPRAVPFSPIVRELPPRDDGLQMQTTLSQKTKACFKAEGESDEAQATLRARRPRPRLRARVQVQPPAHRVPSPDDGSQWRAMVRRPCSSVPLWRSPPPSALQTRAFPKKRRCTPHKTAKTNEISTRSLTLLPAIGSPH